MNPGPTDSTACVLSVMPPVLLRSGDGGLHLFYQDITLIMGPKAGWWWGKSMGFGVDKPGFMSWPLFHISKCLSLYIESINLPERVNVMIEGDNE